MSGLEWSTNDLWDPIRLNKKTRFVGSGLQATTFITSPQIGQMVLPTSNDGVFYKEKLAIYNAAGTTWKTPHAIETDVTYPQNGSRTGHTVDDYNRFYHFYTLPSTYDFYIIYEITGWRGIKATDGVNETLQAGVCIFDQVNPTIESAVLVGITPKINYTDGTDFDFDAEYTHSIITDPIPGGSVIGIWSAGWNADVSTDYVRSRGITGGASVTTKQVFTTWEEDMCATGVWAAASADSNAEVSFKYYGYN